MTLICMNEMTWLMHDDDWCPYWGWECFGYQGFFWNDGLKLIPDTSSGLNGCRRLRLSSLKDIGRTCPCVYCLAPVCWAFEVLCLDFRPTYWYWFSLSERCAPRLSHSETCLAGPTGSSCDLPLVIRVCFWLAESQGDLHLIKSVLIWFAPD